MRVNKIRRNLMLCCALTAGMTAYADTEFYIENFTVKSGNTYELPICVNSDGLDLYGIQCDLTLPEGVTPKQTAEGIVTIPSTERCLSGHSVVAEYVDNGNIRILVHHDRNYPFNGTNGAILSIPIEVNVEPGDYTVKLSGCRSVVKPEDTYIEQKCAEYSAKMTVLPGRRWSVNQLYAEDVTVGEGSNAVLELGYYSPFDVYEYSVDVVLPAGVTATDVDFEPVVADVPNFSNNWNIEGGTLKVSGEYGGDRRDLPAEGGELTFAKVTLNTSSLTAGEYEIVLRNQMLSNDDDDFKPADYTVKLTVTGPIRLTDDGTEYTNDTDIEHADIIYTRNFQKVAWQALYLPYEMAYEEWADKGEMAQLNNVHQYDTDNDGVLDTTTLEFEKVTEGSIRAHVPYVFRPYAAGDAEFTSLDRTLKAAPESDGSVDCSSTALTYTIYGNYRTKEGLYNLDAYALNNNGVFTKAKDAAQTLKPHRIYLLVTEKNVYGAPAMLPGEITVTVDGEVTGIEDLMMMNESDGVVYDLSGRKVANPGEGIFIVNGKKIYLK